MKRRYYSKVESEYIMGNRGDDQLRAGSIVKFADSDATYYVKGTWVRQYPTRLVAALVPTRESQGRDDLRNEGVYKARMLTVIRQTKSADAKQY